MDTDFTSDGYADELRENLFRQILAQETVNARAYLLENLTGANVYLEHKLVLLKAIEVDVIAIDEIIPKLEEWAKSKYDRVPHFWVELK